MMGLAHHNRIQLFNNCAILCHRPHPNATAGTGASTATATATVTAAARRGMQACLHVGKAMPDCTNLPIHVPDNLHVTNPTWLRRSALAIAA